MKGKIDLNIISNLNYFSLIYFLMTTISVKAQNEKNFYYIIKKKDIDNGKLKIVYKDQNDSIRPLQMCYSKLKAEGLSLQDGVAVFHFEKIPSSKFDTTANCISNNTLLGRFEIDIKKRKIGGSGEFSGELISSKQLF
jgi:hypothetical protein